MLQGLRLNLRHWRGRHGGPSGAHIKGVRRGGILRGQAVGVAQLWGDLTVQDPQVAVLAGHRLGAEQVVVRVGVLDPHQHPAHLTRVGPHRGGGLLREAYLAPKVEQQKLIVAHHVRDQQHNQVEQRKCVKEVVDHSEVVLRAPAGPRVHHNSVAHGTRGWGVVREGAQCSNGNKELQHNDQDDQLPKGPVDTRDEQAREHHLKADCGKPPPLWSLRPPKFFSIRPILHNLAILQLRAGQDHPAKSYAHVYIDNLNDVLDRNLLSVLVGSREGDKVPMNNRAPEFLRRGSEHAHHCRRLPLPFHHLSCHCWREGDEKWSETNTKCNSE
eukprot:RCo028451